MPDVLHFEPDPNCVAGLPGFPAVLPQPGPAAPAGTPCDIEGLKGFPDGMPMPGSKEFCQSTELIKAAFGKIGEQLLTWFQVLDVTGDIKDKFTIKPTGKQILIAVDAVIAAWNAFVSASIAQVDWQVGVVRSVVKQLLALQKCLTNACNPEAHIGIWGTKMLLAIVEELQVGITFGIDATLKIPIRFELVHMWLDLMEKYFCPMELPSPESATRAWLLGRISLEQRDCIWLLHGQAPQTYEPFALVDREQLDWREAIQWVRRQGWGDAAEKDELRKRGFVYDVDVAMAQEMYWELPTIADHLHWLQRQVFDADYVQKYQLDVGFEDKFWPAFGPNLTALGMRKENAKHHYEAHWIMPSPEQMKEFLYRTDEIKQETGTEFNLNDFERLLAEQDYNVLARQWFKATAYQVPAISYIKEWFRQGIINREQLESYHRRLGFSFDDAAKFADIDDLQKRRMRTTAAKGWTTKAATDAWFAGQIDDDKHTELYASLGYDMYEAGTARDVAKKTYNSRVVMKSVEKAMGIITTTLTSAVDVGIMTPDDAAYQLTAAGWNKDNAVTFARLQSAAAGTKRIRQAITYLRRMVLSGVVNLATAQTELVRMGLVQDAVQSYLVLWRLQMTPGRKRRSASQVVNDVAVGHIDTPTAVVMLTNLGYTDADTRLYLADAQAKVVKLAQGRLAANDKKGKARSAALAKLAAESRRQHNAIMKDLKREMPVAKLEKWAKLGIIGKDLFFARMRLYGYQDIDIDRYYREACHGKTAACVDQTPGPSQADGAGDSGGGTSGGSGK